MGGDRGNRSHIADSVNAYWRSRPGTFAGAGGPRPNILFDDFKFHIACTIAVDRHYQLLFMPEIGIK